MLEEHFAYTCDDAALVLRIKNNNKFALLQNLKLPACNEISLSRNVCMEMCWGGDYELGNKEKVCQFIQK